jgi:hypothetical protein
MRGEQESSRTGEQVNGRDKPCSYIRGRDKPCYIRGRGKPCSYDTKR